MEANEEWVIPNSDDERDEELILASKNDDKYNIPTKVLQLYDQIEQNKVLEINVQEYRKAIPVEREPHKDDCDMNEEGKLEEDCEDESKDAKSNIDNEEELKQDKQRYCTVTNFILFIQNAVVLYC